MKRNEDSLRDLWDNIRHNDICIIGVPEGEEKEKGLRKYIFEDIIAENFQHEKGNTHSSPGSAENPVQDEPKEEHTKTHINQTDKS